MIVEIKRTLLTDTVTLGALTVYDQIITTYRCMTLELPWRNNAVGKSCIPEGTYDLLWTPSPRFGATYQVMGVPDRSAVRIHVANYTRQLRGCIAPCMSHADIDADGVIDGTHSRKALDGLHAVLGTGAGKKHTLIIHR